MTSPMTWLLKGFALEEEPQYPLLTCHAVGTGALCSSILTARAVLCDGHPDTGLRVARAS